MVQESNSVQEFHLSVSYLRNDEVYIRVEQAEKGIPLAEEQVFWPIQKWLTQARQVFTDPLSEFFQASPEDPYEMIPVDPLSTTPRLPTEPALIGLGQELYEALFQGTVGARWLMAQGVAQHCQKRLRLRLSLKDDCLARLPWEVMQAGARPIAASDDVIFSRSQSRLSQIASIHKRLLDGRSLPGSLNILVVLAAPSDQANLELRREALQLQEELQRHRSDKGQDTLPEIRFKLLEQPGREELTQQLERSDYQIFHFSGHSSPGPAGGSLHLVNSHSGLTESLSGDDLAGLLANNGIRLAVLNSCFSTQAATSEAFEAQGERTLAESLIRRGIPGVLAMAERIPDQVALTLSRLFYRNIRLGYPLDLSLCRARQGLISAYGSNQLYWALPILYLQSDFEGCLVEAAGVDDGSLSYEEPLEMPLEFPQGAPGLPALATPAGASAYRSGAALAKPTLGAEERGDRPLDPSISTSAHNALDDSLLLNRPDPEIFDAVSRLEQDLSGEDLSVPPLSPTSAEQASASGLMAQAAGSTVQAASASGAASGDLALRPEAAPAVRPGSNPPGPTELSPQGIAASAGAVQERPVPGAVRRPASSRLRPGPMPWLLAGAAGMLLLGGGIWELSSRFSDPSPVASEISAARQPSEELVNATLAGLEEGDYEQVEAAIAALLDRDDLEAAGRAIGLLNAQQLEDAEAGLLFLRGRLNWQRFDHLEKARLSGESPSDLPGLQLREPEEALNQALRDWDFAANSKPENADYRNALGFALLEEGRLTEAKNRFDETIKRLSDNGKAEAEYVQALAGQTVTLFRLAEEKPDQRAELLEQALARYDVVRSYARQQYSVENMGKDVEGFWLWTNRLILDWQAIGNLK